MMVSCGAIYEKCIKFDFEIAAVLLKPTYSVNKKKG